MALIYQNILSDLIGFCSLEWIYFDSILMIRSGFEIGLLCSAQLTIYRHFSSKSTLLRPSNLFIAILYEHNKKKYIFLYIRTNLVINAG